MCAQNSKLEIKRAFKIFIIFQSDVTTFLTIHVTQQALRKPKKYFYVTTQQCFMSLKQIK